MHPRRAAHYTSLRRMLPSPSTPPSSGEARAGSDIDICVLYDGAPGDSRVVSGNVRAAIHPFLRRARMECDVIAYPVSGDAGAAGWDQDFHDRVMREGVSLCSNR